MSKDCQALKVLKVKVVLLERRVLRVSRACRVKRESEVPLDRKERPVQVEWWEPRESVVWLVPEACLEQRVLMAWLVVRDRRENLDLKVVVV